VLLPDDPHNSSVYDYCKLDVQQMFDIISEYTTVFVGKRPQASCNSAVEEKQIVREQRYAVTENPAGPESNENVSM
jgi:hypothetical protein